MTGSPLLQLVDVDAGYSGSVVVRGLSLDVERGEVVALLGPNGAGKTTTLRTVSGLLPIIDGEVRLDGQRVSGLKPHKVAQLGIAHVPEDRGLFTQLTVAENLRVGRAAAADAALEYFPALRDLLDRRAGLLSGGEQQMLAIGRALAFAPKVLMVDELSLGLAPVIVERLLPVLRSFARDTGTGVILVEQHTRLALEYADRACILVHGDMALTEAADVLRDNSAVLESAYLGEHAIDEIAH